MEDIAKITKVFLSEEILKAAELNNIVDTVNDLIDRTYDVSTRLSYTDSSVADISVKVENINSSLNDLDYIIATSLNDLNTKISNISSNQGTDISDLSTRIANVSTYSFNTSVNLYELTNRVDDLSTDIDDINSSLQEIDIVVSNALISLNDDIYDVSVFAHNVSTYAVNVSTHIGKLADLSTNDKTTIVAAINEVYGKAPDTYSRLEIDARDLDVSARVGSLEDLSTDIKTSAVDAINELSDTIAEIDETTGKAITNMNNRLEDVSIIIDDMDITISAALNAFNDDLTDVSSKIKNISINNAELTTKVNNTYTKVEIDTRDLDVSARIGNLLDLSTNDKTNTVLAINELYQTIEDLDDTTTTALNSINLRKVDSDTLGDLSDLYTDDKTSIVNSINELYNDVSDLDYNVAVALNDLNTKILNTSNNLAEQVLILNDVSSYIDTMDVVISKSLNNLDERIIDISSNMVTLTAILNSDIVDVSAKIGDLTDLSTNIKANIVSAINSLYTDVSTYEYVTTESLAALTENDEDIYSRLSVLLTGSVAVSNINNIPITKKLVISTIKSSGTYGLSGIPYAGQEIHTIILNSSTGAIDIAIPTTGNYINTGDSTISIAASGYGEVNAISDGTKIYVRGI